MRTTSRALMYGLYDEFQISLKCPHAPPNSSFSICHAQAAFLSGVCEAMLCPLERVQVLLQTTKFHDKFKNTLHAFSRLKEYGYREYYRGFSVILVRNSLSNTLFFTLRDPLKHRIVSLPQASRLPCSLQHWIGDFIAGSLLGATISTAFFPLGVVKNHMQAKIVSLPQASRLPCSLQHWIGDFIAGSLLGATISTAFFPLGVVKNHMQAKVGVNYDSGLRVFRDVWQLRNRSLRNLYLGVHLNFTRSLVAWGIINSMYGILRRALAPFE
ncbi:Protein CBG21695 [Caenorhabditis briggsae]|uniref:Protein CBG21695 n=1 Tax=Caenorhabditis briggsae TaxID=6238 RepID=A8Y0Q2_CAEBR|nr:Protein CBG21695 [Caenorhabditis briggsae]CAP38472.2 Protein CBG21695 [Caenorhabditis briggsae]